MGLPGTGSSASLSFGLDNQLELKVFPKGDTTENAKPKKIPILKQFSFSSAYNFEADSNNLSNISIRGNTTLFQTFNLNFSANVDPYAYLPDSFDEETGEVSRRYRSREYAWDRGQGFGTITSAQFATGIQLGPPKKKKGQKDKNKLEGEEGDLSEEEEEDDGLQGIGNGDDPDDDLLRQRMDQVGEGERQMLADVKKKVDEIEEKRPLTPEERQIIADIVNDPYSYVNFNIPWSLNINYNLRYNNRPSTGETQIVQTVQLRGDISITEKWKVGFSSSYDFQNQEFGFTSLNVSRDLHCWQMNLNWVPFGPRQSYTLDIAVKSQILQDLKINKRNSWLDRPSSQRF
jgi:hypothetical protein